MLENGLVIDYTALTDQKTPVNLTNHAYFNLSAGMDSTILNEELTIYASKYTPVNDSLIPTGQLVSVNSTPFDFRKAKKIGKDLEKVKGGYDHNFVIDKKDSLLNIAAIVFDPGSGRKMEVWTTQPGIQFYTGNFLNGTFNGTRWKKELSSMAHYVWKHNIFRIRQISLDFQIQSWNQDRPFMKRRFTSFLLNRNLIGLSV